MVKRILEQEVELFVQQDPWKLDGDSAMVSLEIQECIAFAEHVFNRLLRIDSQARMQAFQDDGQIEESEKICLRVENSFRRLLAPTERLLELIRDFMRAGHEAEGFFRLEKWVAEIRGMLTPDETFFAGEALANLEREAREDYANGRTQKIEVLDD